MKLQCNSVCIFIEFNYEAEYHYLHELHEASQDNQEKTATAVDAGACAVLPSEDGTFILHYVHMI